MPETIATPTLLAHQFDDLEQQYDASTLGMWTFLATEVMFFGGLFAAYAIYRLKYPEAFGEASHHLDRIVGAVNTGVLLVSSLTMALAVRAAQLGRRQAAVLLLLATAVFGSAFLGVKAYEYSEKFHDHLVPGYNFHYEGPLAGGVELFILLYFVMTGIHALHLIIGVAVVLIVAFLLWRRWFSGFGVAQIEVTGLYWHFIDIIWVFLYPLLYLIHTLR